MISLFPVYRIPLPTCGTLSVNIRGNKFLLFVLLWDYMTQYGKNINPTERMEAFSTDTIPIKQISFNEVREAYDQPKKHKSS